MLLLAHVRFEFFLHPLQQRHQAVGAVRVRGVGALHALGQRQQRGELLAMALVVALEDVLDQFGVTRLAPVALCAGRAQGAQFAGDALGVQAQFAGGFAQAALAGAAEVQLVVAQQAGAAGQAAGQVR